MPEGISFTVFDESILEAAVEKSRAGTSGDWDFFGPPRYPGDYHADLESALNQPASVLYKSDTLKGLAEKMGVNADNLAETVRHYNEMCAIGRDEDFFKKPEQMIPFTKAPYYAVRCSMGTDGAFGGVLVNKDTQAYSKDGGLVEGLYAVGDFTSGRFINMSGVKKQIINDLAWAFASGFIAADRVSKYLSK